MPNTIKNEPKILFFVIFSLSHILEKTEIIIIVNEVDKYTISILKPLNDINPQNEAIIKLKIVTTYHSLFFSI